MDDLNQYSNEQLVAFTIHKATHPESPAGIQDVVRKDSLREHGFVIYFNGRQLDFVSDREIGANVIYVED